MKETKDKKTIIEIEEEVTIPQEDGTKVILEKGDKIKVFFNDKKELDEQSYSPMILSSIENMIETINKFHTGDPADLHDLGQYIASIIVNKNLFLAEGIYMGLDKEI